VPKRSPEPARPARPSAQRPQFSPGSRVDPELRRTLREVRPWLAQGKWRGVVLQALALGAALRGGMRGPRASGRGGSSGTRDIAAATAILRACPNPRPTQRMTPDSAVDRLQPSARPPGATGSGHRSAHPLGGWRCELHSTSKDGI
jgi:hypothetical protein